MIVHGSDVLYKKGKLLIKKNALKVCYNVTFLKKIFAPTKIGMQQGYNKFFSKIQWSLDTSVYQLHSAQTKLITKNTLRFTIPKQRQK